MCYHAWLFKWMLRITTRVVMLKHDFVHWASHRQLQWLLAINFILTYCSNWDLECSPSVEGLVPALWYYREVVEFLWPPIGKLLALYQRCMHWKGWWDTESILTLFAGYLSCASFLTICLQNDCLSYHVCSQQQANCPWWEAMGQNKFPYL